MNDVRQWIFGAIIGLLACIGLMLGIVYVSSCGFSLTCYQASPIVIRTPIPTLIPVSHEAEPGGEEMPEFGGCLVSGADLVGAWVTAGSPETGTFPFTSTNGDTCEGTYADDIQHLFVDNNVWYAGQLGCTSCHNADLTDRSGGLDLSSYQGVLAGAQNKNILGDGNWDGSILHDVLLVHGLVPEGHSPDVEPHAPIFIYAGQQTASTDATPTATP